MSNLNLQVLNKNLFSEPTPGCSSWTISFTPVKSNEKKREEGKDDNTKPHKPVISDSKIPSKYLFQALILH